MRCVSGSLFCGSSRTVSPKVSFNVLFYVSGLKYEVLNLAVTRPRQCNKDELVSQHFKLTEYCE